jgi:uncharacterized protein YdaU (DUF1376 family)
MSTVPYMPTFVSDLLSDTLELNLEQFGAYSKIINYTWRIREWIPDDPKHVARILGCTRHRWVTKIRPFLRRFFDWSEGFLVNKRLASELEKAEKKAGISRENGKLGGRPKASDEASENNPAGYTLELPLESESSGDAKPATTESFSESPALERNGSFQKFVGLGSGISVGAWADQQRRDEYAASQCVRHLPGRDDGERWEIALAAEDPAHPDHERCCRMMRAAAKKARVGWVSPALRGRHLEAAE